MAPTSKLDYRCCTCSIVNITENKCQCVENPNELDIDSTNKKFEIIAKGQNVIHSALRSLRLNKSTSITETDDPDKVLNVKKCRLIISLREVFEHDNYDDCWIVLYDRVYDVTQFLNQVHNYYYYQFKWNYEIFHFARITTILLLLLFSILVELM